MKIGYVLSGGGARGVAHLGIFKALEEFGIKPSIISGTSAGGIIGAFYSAGFKPEKIISILKESKVFNRHHLKIGRPGIFDMLAFESVYKKYFKEDSFESLPIPLFVAATDIIEGEIRYFSSGILSRAIMASSCIPVVFEPVEYQGMTLVDGGVLNNFPVEPLLNNCDKIIGIHVNAINKENVSIHMTNVLDRSFHFALSNSVYSKVKNCDLFFDPPRMSRFSMFDMKNADEIFSFSYEYAKKVLKEKKIAEEWK